MAARTEALMGGALMREVINEVVNAAGYVLVTAIALWIIISFVPAVP